MEAGGRAGARGAGRAGGCGEGEVVEVGRVELLVAGGCLDEDAGWRLLVEVAWFTERGLTGSVTEAVGVVGLEEVFNGGLEVW